MCHYSNLKKVQQSEVGPVQCGGGGGIEHSTVNKRT